jgi:hypothetical protein
MVAGDGGALRLTMFQLRHTFLGREVEMTWPLGGGVARWLVAVPSLWARRDYAISDGQRSGSRWE